MPSLSLQSGKGGCESAMPPQVFKESRLEGVGEICVFSRPSRTNHNLIALMICIFFVRVFHRSIIDVEMAVLQLSSTSDMSRCVCFCVAHVHSVVELTLA